MGRHLQPVRNQRLITNPLIEIGFQETACRLSLFYSPSAEPHSRLPILPSTARWLQPRLVTQHGSRAELSQPEASAGCAKQALLRSPDPLPPPCGVATACQDTHSPPICSIPTNQAAFPETEFINWLYSCL